MSRVTASISVHSYLKPWHRERQGEPEGVDLRGPDSHPSSSPESVFIGVINTWSEVALPTCCTRGSAVPLARLWEGRKHASLAQVSATWLVGD